MKTGSDHPRRSLALTLLLLLAAVWAAASSAEAVQVPAAAGVLEGSTRADGVHAFLGVPYAAAPVGDLRFRPPQPHPGWDGVRAATAAGPACMQRPRAAGAFYPDYAAFTSEDCLTLNVWTTQLDGAAPVMVWLHGGALTRGSGNGAAFDGGVLAHRDVVVVTLNYRLNVFGFLAHPALMRESRERSSGNYGFLDQIEALRWVRDNIAAFGGDPGNVTIFGESAGAWSVNVLMASPLARGLFQRAIGQSGGRMAAMTKLRGSRRNPGAADAGRDFARGLGARNARDLRALDAQALLDGFAAWTGPAIAEPIVDGWLLERSVREVFEAGEQAPVPVLVGYNRDEGTLLAGAQAPSDAAAYTAQLQERLGNRAAAFSRIYGPQDDARGAYLRSYRDRTFAWPMHSWARLMETARRPAWLYYFVRAPEVPGWPDVGAYHAAEIPYVFGNLPATATDVDQTLSDAMMAYWSAFARTGDPNDAELARWPAYTGGKVGYLEFGTFVGSGRGLNADAIAFWDAVWADSDDGIEP